MKINALTKMLAAFASLIFTISASGQCQPHSTAADWRSSVSNSPSTNSIEDKYRYWYCNFRKYRKEDGNYRSLDFPFELNETDEHLFIKHYTNSSLALLKETYSEQPAFSPGVIEEEVNYTARSLLRFPAPNAPTMNKDRYDTLFQVINTLSLIHERRLDEQAAANKDEIVRIREFYDFVNWRCILQNGLLDDFSKTLERRYPFTSRMIQSRITTVSQFNANQVGIGKCSDIVTSLIL